MAHAHLNYPDWWKPEYETEVMESPPPPDLEARTTAFAERNSPENIEKLAREFFGMIDLDLVQMKPKYVRLDKWGRNEQRADYEGAEETPVVDIRALVETGHWRGALDAYREFFFDRLLPPPPAFEIKYCHPLLRQFVEFIHQPDELLDNVTRLTMLDADDKGAVVKLDMGAPGQVNWTWFPPQYQTYDWMIFPHDGSFMIRCVKLPIFYNALLGAYMDTGDPRYLEKWSQFMDDRAMNLSRDCQAAGFRGAPDNHSGVGSAIGTFGNLMAVAARRPETVGEFPAATLARLLIEAWRSVPTNMRMAREASTNRSIHMYSQSCFWLAVSFPEFVASQYVVRERMRVLESYATVTMMPDGSNIENSDGYNTSYIITATEVWDIICAMGKARPAWISPDWYQELRENLNLLADYRIHRKGNLGWDWYPNFYTPRYASDFAGENPRYLDLLPESLVEPENRKVISTLWGDGSAGVPSFTSECWPYSGQCVIRSGWDRDAQHLYMDSPLPYTSHTWKNANDIQLFAFGQPLLTLHTDGYGFNRSGYAEDPTYSEWQEGMRQGIRDKYGNQDMRGLYQWEYTPLFVDGLPQIGHEAFPKQSFEFRSQPGPMYGRMNGMAYQTPLENRWHESTLFNLAEGEYAGPFASLDGEKLVEGVSHRRQLVFLRELEMWIVLDRANSAQKHTYKLDWKFAQPFESNGEQVPGFTEEQVIAGDTDRSVRTANPDNANISIYMHSPAELEMHPRGAEFAGAGPQLVVSALYPRRQLTDELQMMETLAGKDGVTGFETLLPDGTRLLCQAAADQASAAALAAGELQATGEALVLAILPDGSRYGIILGCQSLTVAGAKQNVLRPDFEFAIGTGGIELVAAIHRPMNRVEVFPKADRFEEEVEVTMTHSAPDTEMRYTLDGGDPTLDSPLYSGSLLLRGTTMLKATAFRQGLAEMPKTVSGTVASMPIRAYYVKRPPLELTESSAPGEPGLRYTYYEGDWTMGGQMTSLPDPSQRGDVAELLDLPHRTDNSFMYDYEGFLNIPTAGVYTLHCPWEMITPTQDAGYDLRLWIGEEEWYPTTRWHNFGGWSVPLEAGLYPLRVVYVDQRASEMLVRTDGHNVWQGEKPVIEVSGPGIERQPLPSAWLSR